MSFSTLGLSDEIIRAVTDRGYTTPSPIQVQAIPAILEGRDLLAGAQTGTGKTAGFTLPILEILSKRAPRSSGKRSPVRALILAPTRELAAQVEESVSAYGKYLKLSSFAIFGGVSINSTATPSFHPSSRPIKGVDKSLVFFYTPVDDTFTLTGGALDTNERPGSSPRGLGDPREPGTAHD